MRSRASLSSPMSPSEPSSKSYTTFSGHQKQHGNLFSKLAEPSMPVFLLGTMPPKQEDSSLSHCMESAVEFVTRSRVLAYDGFLIHCVADNHQSQDVEAAAAISGTEANKTEEWENVGNTRRFMDPVQYANLICNMARSHNCTQDCIVTKVISEADLSDKVDKRIDSVSAPSDHKAIQLVSGTKMKGGDIKKSDKKKSPFVRAVKNLKRREHFKGRRGRPPLYGGVAFAERHMLDATEHLHMVDQQKAGAEWFLTMPIYDPEPIQRLLKDYATACVANGIIPKKVILTFAPFCDTSSLQFIQSYYGVTVPETIQSRVLSAPNPEKESADCLRDVFVSILESSQGLELPSLGIHCLQIGHDPSDMDVTRDLFLKLQDVLLSSQGTPWRIQWYDPSAKLKNNDGDSDDVRRWKLLFKQGIYAAFVGGGLVAFGVMLGATGDFMSVKVTVHGRDLALSNRIGSEFQ
ncbi:unnamed protein product [Cylindrotheca closterium]|uniref:Uncharacterized protein n=1 Tax=Cylindrotheca closterium TaxID=2856 RepID=A0AAD2CPW3_9STRA|nr:unnamed protein product [Cylindrotheca closterium]